MDASRVETQIIGGEACVLASSVQSSDNTFALRQELSSLAEEFPDFGKQLVDRYLSTLRPASNCRVVLVESGLSVRVGLHAAFQGTAHPEKDWLQLAQQRGQCAVLIMAGAPNSHSTTLSAHFRTAASRKLCFGASAPFLDYSRGKSIDLVRYRSIAPNGDLSYPTPATALCILDSNVLLDMEMAARGRLNGDALDDLKQIVTNIWFQDATPGFAISELCWTGPSGMFRKDRHASLRSTMDAWFDCEHRPIELDQKYLMERYEGRLRSYEGGEVLVDLPDIRWATSAAYCSLLKAASLSYRIDGFKANQRVDLFAEYCDFVSNQIQFLSAYAFQVARDMLVARPADSEYTKRLLKFGKNILGDLWGASWDVMYLWFSDHVETDAELNPFSLKTVLITADRAIPNLRHQLRPTEDLGYADGDGNRRRLKVGALELDKRLEPKRQEIFDLSNTAFRAALDRVTQKSSSDSLEERLLPHIESLEKQVLSEAKRDQQERASRRR